MASPINSSWIKAAKIQRVFKTSTCYLCWLTLISFIEIRRVKYLNNLIEQEHRFIKKITKPMIGFKAFHSAKAAAIDAIETAPMIRKK